MTLLNRLKAFAPLAVALSVVGAGAVYAQLEGADRGVPPIDSASTLEIGGIQVDVADADPEKAREEGWRRAQALGWRALWARTTGRPVGEAPALSDSALSAIVSGIVIEQEQIGPHRYIATLGVLFDRARTGQLLGVGGIVRRSAPMLVIPILQTGSSMQSFESRTAWQHAWARYRTAGSTIDYVRPSGSGIDPLLLNAHQANRPGRRWWRLLLDQYGAADVIMPEVRLRRLYPGGPAVGLFTARHGPDNRVVGYFALRVENSAAIPRMLDEGIRRLDQIYMRALEEGRLQSDPGLVIEEAEVAEEIEQAAEAAQAIEQDVEPARPIPMGHAASFSIQVATPDASSVQQAELSVSRIRGVTSALTTSLALGGTSVMRVTFNGDPAALQTALQAQGWTVEGSGNSLRISWPGGEE